jgi:hypothetical protein
MSDSPTTTGAPANPWRTAGGDNSRRGLFRGKAGTKLAVARRLEAQGAVQASVVFDLDGGAYVLDMAGHAQAFDAGGRLRWRVPLSGGVAATPALTANGKTLFAGTFTGWVQALDTVTGKELWRQRVASTSDSRILSDLLHLPEADLVVLSSWGGRYHALDATSGKEEDSWDAGISPCAGAASDAGGHIYTLRAVRDQGVQLVCRHSGAEMILHSEPEGTRGARRAMVAAAPVVDEARQVIYYVVNRDGGSVVDAWSLEQQHLLWSWRFPQGITATPALTSEGTLLVADLGGALHGLGPEGTPLFRYVSGCEYLLTGPVCDMAGNYFLADPTGVCHRVTASGVGQTVFEAPRSLQGRPSFDPQGRLYLPCTDRQVYVLGAQTKS